MSLVLECSIRAGLIAAAVAGILAGLRIVSAPPRHTAWTGVLAAMLMLPAFSAWMPKATIPVLPVVEVQAVVLAPAPLVPSAPLQIETVARAAFPARAMASERGAHDLRRGLRIPPAATPARHYSGRDASTPRPT